MKVKDMMEALQKAADKGNGDAEVVWINGQGKAVPVVGWQLVTSAQWDHGHDPASGLGQQLRLYSGSRF